VAKLNSWLNTCATCASLARQAQGKEIAKGTKPTRRLSVGFSLLKMSLGKQRKV